MDTWTVGFIITLVLSWHVFDFSLRCWLTGVYEFSLR